MCIRDSLGSLLDHHDARGTPRCRFEAKGLKLVALKMRQFSPALFEQHYEPHKGKPFYPGLVKYMSSAPVVALALEGVDAIEVVRGLMGATNSRRAAPGTTRGDLGMSFSNNLVHGSDSVASAKREIEIFFEGQRLASWKRDVDPWVFE